MLTAIPHDSISVAMACTYSAVSLVEYVFFIILQSNDVVLKSRLN